MNVIMICLDTFRADCLNARGLKPFMKTPNLDRLATEGVLFENAFGEAHPTIQFRRTLCTGMRGFPWRFQFDIRGVWPHNDGWHKIPPEQTTLAELLLQNGYITGLSADTYHLFKPTFNFTRGMASWDAIRGQETDNYRAGPLSAIDVKKYLPPGKTDEGKRLVQYLLNVQDRKSKDDYFPAKVFASACRFLDDVRDTQPFFLWIDSFDPHEPWDPPDEYANLYDPDWDEGWEPIFNLQSNKHNEKTIKRHIARYYGECTFVDECLGRLLDKLESLKLLDETMIVVCSDHGTESMDHGMLHKGVHRCRYRHNNEILCLMRFPGKAHAGKRIEPFVMSHDLFPTIAAACGAAHEPIDGHDLMPLIEGKTESLYDTIITGWSRWASVRNSDYAYCGNYTTEDPDETLFDLNADPEENNNIANEHPDLSKDFRAQLEDFLGAKLPHQPPDMGMRTPAPFNVWGEKSQAVRDFFSDM